MSPLILDVLQGKPTPRTPVWLMRQAGRYMASYRKIRGQYSFLEMLKQPDLICEISLLPIDTFNLDAVIVFSDILVVPQALGLTLNFDEGVGPWFENPIRTPEDVARLSLRREDFLAHLAPLYQALRTLRGHLESGSSSQPRKALLGFAGAPWTLACYMIEGRARSDFRLARTFARTFPEAFHQLIELLTNAIGAHLEAQIASGVDAVQIFESHAGLIPYECQASWCLQPISALIGGAHKTHTPVILFPRGHSFSWKSLRATGADALSIDWTHSLADLDGLPIQGNLDPSALFMEKKFLTQAITQTLEAAGSSPHIFNLGHGILVGTPEESVAHLVETVARLSAKK